MSPEEMEENESETQVFGVSSLMVMTMLRTKIENDIEPYFTDHPNMAPYKKVLTKAIDESFQDFKAPTKNIFSVPKNISFLPHLTIPSEEDPKIIEAEVKDLEETYKQHLMYLALLKNEQEELEKLEPIKEKVQKLIQTHKENQDRFDFKNMQLQFNEILDELDYGNIEHAKPC